MELVTIFLIMLGALKLHSMHQTKAYRKTTEEIISLDKDIIRKNFDVVGNKDFGGMSLPLLKLKEESSDD